ncbi:LysR family transcriptional regulator [Bordetella genomosp. 12]|uniref:LysR family transcriptional regulator n=1 Tax=Bordetella genomosp. 12 TaxID=463035 RepID=A0A261VL37_9BORD|nr:LysR family transcriptional regulator [Bordetella genomosp. 12]OZI74805.1 LysR family transcriptional regulator [Bordetella genomosp. 12]
MDFKRLEYFLSVAEHGSFSRAASVIGVAQPALGRQVQRLEESCGARLFYRHGRGVSLTPEGEAFRQRILPLMRELSSAMTGLGDSERPISGLVRIGITPTILSLLGLPLIERLRARHPGLRLNFLSGYSGYVHEWLVDGRLDIAILHDARRSRHIGVDFLGEARLFLISALPPSGPRPVDIATLAQLPLALPSATHGLRRTLEAAAAKARVTLRVDYELDDLSLMKAVAVTGAAHTVLALPAVAEELRDGRLHATALGAPQLATRLMVATSVSRPLTRAARTVAEALAPTLRDALAASERDLGIALA